MNAISPLLLKGAPILGILSKVSSLSRRSWDAKNREYGTTDTNHESIEKKAFYIRKTIFKSMTVMNG